MNKYISISAGIVVIVALLVLITYMATAHQNIAKNNSATTSVPVTSIKNILPKGVVYIKNIFYLVSFQGVNWSAYSSSSCNTNINGVTCYNASSILNTSTQSLKIKISLENKLGFSVYLENNSFIFASSAPYLSGSGNCINQSTGRKIGMLPNNAVASCVITFNNSKNGSEFLPGTYLAPEFSVVYHLCSNLQCSNLSDSSLHLINGNFSATIIPTERNPIINITSRVNLEEAQGLIYTYPAVFETPIALKLSGITAITSGFEVANITPSLPIIFTPGNQKLLHISLSIPTYNYTGNLSIRLNFTAPN
jgi:hypothetical protein